MRDLAYFEKLSAEKSGLIQDLTTVLAKRNAEIEKLLAINQIAVEALEHYAGTHEEDEDVAPTIHEAKRAKSALTKIAQLKGEK